MSDAPQGTEQLSAEDRPVSEQPYKRPPITEAVIEVRFATAIDADGVARAGSDFASVYSLQEHIQNINLGVQLGLDNQPTTQIDRQAGLRRSSPDISQLVLLWPSTFVVAQLAPYVGWNEFFGRFVRDWRIFKKATGYRKITRVGVRFINRIDVPITDAVTRYEDYLNVYAQLPDVLGPVNAYGMQALLHASDTGCNVAINSANVPALLLDHISFLLDIDTFKDVDPPQNDDGVFELLRQIRSKKNAVFEACITNQARELFQK